MLDDDIDYICECGGRIAENPDNPQLWECIFCDNTWKVAPFDDLRSESLDE